MPLSNPGTILMPLSAARALTGVFYVISFLTTLIRLYHRIQLRKFWWDDFWAGFALISGIMSCTIWLDIEHIMHPAQPFSTKHFGVIGMFIAYEHSLWCAKLSVAVTIVRLLGDGRPRTVSKYVAFLFGVAGTTLIFQKAFVCGIHPRYPICPTPIWTGYLELSLDLVADSWLILAPLYALHRVNLAGVHRRLLISIFSCGLFVTAASIARTCFIFGNQNLMTGILGHLELALSLITCNLLVLVTYIYRKVRLSGSSSSMERSTVPPESSIHNGRITVALPAPDTSDISDSRHSYSHITLTTLGSSMLNPLDSNETHATITSAKASPLSSVPQRPTKACLKSRLGFGLRGPKS